LHDVYTINVPGQFFSRLSAEVLGIRPQLHKQQVHTNLGLSFMNASFIAQRYIDSILYISAVLKQSCVKPTVSC